MQVALATTNQLAAEAGRAVVEAGGGAVDAAVAAAVMTLVTEPGICALGSGGYVTVGPPGGEVVTVDGNVEMPGRGADPDRFGRQERAVTMAYGGGVTTIVGYSSVATPGALAALAATLTRWGRVPWRVVLEPTIEVVQAGFPLSAAARHYLEYSHLDIFGWQPDSFAVLHDDQGRLLEVGDLVHIPALAHSLQVLADEGVDTFYRGELAQAIAADFAEHGGLLTLSDLESYCPIFRPAARCESNGWAVATNPPPAVGGVMLLAMLAGLRPQGGVDVKRLVDRQIWAIEQRLAIERTGCYEPGAGELLRMLSQTDPTGVTAPSTVQTSVADSDGLTCAITMSAGYGSGLMPGGTGIWMNNALGEIELNPAGFHSLRPGTRLGSNMAPTVVSSAEGDLVAIGSPGADRITTALQQVIAQLMAGRRLDEAIEAPRLHVEHVEGSWRVAAERGVSLPEIEHPVRWFDGLHMFFGGVAAAMRKGDGSVTAAADSRRTGGVFISP